MSEITHCRVNRHKIESFSAQKLLMLEIVILQDFMKALHMTLSDQMVHVYSRDEMYAFIGRCTEFIYLVYGCLVVYGCFDRGCMGFYLFGVRMFEDVRVLVSGCLGFSLEMYGSHSVFVASTFPHN